ncbi:cell division protein FtsQ [Marinilabiliaceae bacterium ANBcel2]|nr:cell division protein FtsQ [Marinilabiliaceae bacterium ANBcel2]
MKRVAEILKWFFLLGYFPVMISFVSVAERSAILSDVRVHVVDSMEVSFIKGEEIRANLLDNYPSLLGYEISNLNLYQLEQFVKEHSAIMECNIYDSPEGIINIIVEQHKPVVRIFDKNRSFYLNRSGEEIPVSDAFTARVLVVNGAIPNDLDQLKRVVDIIAADSFWYSQIEQIYINDDNQYLLVPRVGDHHILLGEAVDVDIKLRNLKAVYREGLSPQEWNEFKVIDLRYRNQVLCSRDRDINF